MNFGECPYEGCRGWFSFNLPTRTPVYVERKCQECKRQVWYRLSRLEPMAWTKEDFENEFTVDRDAKTIVERHRPMVLGDILGGGENNYFFDAHMKLNQFPPWDKVLVKS